MSTDQGTMSDTAYCTIITKSYLPMRVLLLLRSKNTILRVRYMFCLLTG